MSLCSMSICLLFIGHSLTSVYSMLYIGIRQRHWQLEAQPHTMEFRDLNQATASETLHLEEDIQSRQSDLSQVSITPFCPDSIQAFCSERIWEKRESGNTKPRIPMRHVSTLHIT